MDFCVKGARRLGRGTAEGDPAPSPRYVMYGETGGSKPAGYLADVVGAQSKAIAELLRGQPFVEVWGRWTLLIREKALEPVGRPQIKRGILDRQGGIGESPIELRPGIGIQLPRDLFQLSSFDFCSNAILRGHCRRQAHQGT